MKIRIGNDIRFKVQLSFGEENGFANIHVARAFFVNSTLKEELENTLKRKNRFFSKFPIPSFTDEYESTAYNINSTGYPKYFAAVPNRYNGFGLNPNWSSSFPIKELNITEYESTISHDANIGTIIVDFPAEAQMYPGKYELVVVAQIYNSGYSGNVRTVTANYKDIFELVTDSQAEDVDNPVSISIINTINSEEPTDVYVESGKYNDNAIKLRRTDGNIINIDVNPINGWYVED